MEIYLLYMPIAVAALALSFKVLRGFCRFLGLGGPKGKNIIAAVAAVIVLFVLGFGLRISADSSLIDMGYFLTDLSFLLSYLLIGFAALLGQVKYHCG